MHGGNSLAIARERGWDWREVLDFSASINPLGPSPLVRDAVIENLDRIAHYPEREPTRLVIELARLWQICPEQVLVGNGATELIYFLSRILRSSEVALALPVFSEFHRAFPLATYADLAEVTTWPSDRTIVLTRPANPLGSLVSMSAIREWLERTQQLAIIDESFVEFTESSTTTSLLNDYPNLIILRSLTKFYALPGLRIGAILGTAAAVTQWRKQREPWQVNSLAEAAALAAIADTEHGARSIAFVRSERDWLLEQLRTLPGVDPLPSEANFLYVRLAYPSRSLYDFLLTKKILVRDCSGWPGLTGEAVRVAVRSRQENLALLEQWRQLCV